jgi:hypothetical protein
MADGEWRMADGEWRMADGGWRMADGGWRMADGGWRMADGEWRMANGGNGQKVAGLPCRADFKQPAAAWDANLLPLGFEYRTPPLRLARQEAL